jgi:hypothetical protein
MDVKHRKGNEMRLSKRGRRPEARVTPIHALLGAAILGLLVMPIAFAGAKSPVAQTSASPKRQIQALKRRVTALEKKAVPAPNLPPTLPPSGPAGGALLGTYPNPQIGPNTIGAPEIAAGAVRASEFGRLISMQTQPQPVAPGERASFSITCPAGASLLGGGFDWGNTDAPGARILSSGTVVPDGVTPAQDPNNNPVWAVQGRVDANGQANTLIGKILCLAP